MTVDAAGQSYIALALNYDVTVGSKLVSHVGGGWDAAVIAIEPDGTVAWFKGAAGTGDDGVTDLAVGPDGDLLVAGTFVADVDVAGAVMVDVEMGGVDSFLVKLAANNGALRWSVQYGGVGPQLATALATDGTGNVYVVGEYQWALTLDDGGLGETTAGDVNAFVDKRDSLGEEQWHLALGDEQEQRLRSVAVTSEGAPLVVDFGGTIAFDDASSITAEDGATVRERAPQQPAIMVQELPGAGLQTLYAVALDAEASSPVLSTRSCS